MKKKVSLIVILVFCVVSESYSLDPDSPAGISVSDSVSKNFGLFLDDKLLEITLRFDLSTYFRTKPKEEYLNANITFHLSKTDSVNADIKLRTRGEFRNQYCSFSPIELNFKKVKFGYEDLNKISKIKLVPECKSGSQNENYVLREYLIYKLFSVFTDTSFRVRLLTVNYIDTKKNRKPISQYGFFIEPVEMLAKRTNSVQDNSLTLNQKSIVPKVMDRLALFNYMIGNYDWAVPGQHNVKILRPLDQAVNSPAIAIPYDFDWTGIVNADYAIPAEVIGTQNIRQRVFYGVCRSREVFLKDLEIFVEKKEEFYRVIREFPYMKENEKKDIIGYLDEFYNQFTGKRDLVGYLLETCKNF